MAWNSSECACDADWTPQEIYDLRAVVLACAEALKKALPYVSPLACKNSTKGDEAMGVLSYMTKAMHMARELPGIATKGLATKEE